MCDLARRNDFRWDAILGADYARDLSRRTGSIVAAADAFSLTPDQCLMCAAHGSDLTGRRREWFANGLYRAPAGAARL